MIKLMILCITIINKLWRYYYMYKGTMSVVKGVGIGMLAGAAAVTVGSQLMKDKKHLKKNAGKAIHAVGELMNNVEYMFK